MFYDKYLSIAISAVQAASEVTSRIQDKLVSDDTVIKKDRSPVTIADFAAQAVVCKTLKENFPQIPIVGEEDSGFLQQEENSVLLDKINEFLPSWNREDIAKYIDMGNGEPDELFWTLDPVDGTKGFIRKQQYAVGLALVFKGKPVLGVLGCPNLLHNDKRGCLAYAVSDNGAFIRGLGDKKAEVLKVSSEGREDSIRFLEGVESGHSNHDLQDRIMKALSQNSQVVRYDSMVKYCVLSRGEADVYLRLPNSKSPDYKENIWDHAAGVAIIEEAGGKVSDMYGKDLDFGQGKKLFNNRGVIVTNGRLHEDVIKVVNE